MSRPSPPEGRRRRGWRKELRRQKQQQRRGAEAGLDEDDEEDDVEVEHVPLRPPTVADLLTAAAMTLIALAVGAAYWIHNGTPAPW